MLRKDVVFLMVALMTAVACSDDDGPFRPADSGTGPTEAGVDAAVGAVVIIAGEVYVRTGYEIRLTATTVGGTDSAYTWTSSAPHMASVDDTGLVKGLRDGETTITATGVDTGASGSITIISGTEMPAISKWSSSGHGNYNSEAYRHWDDEDPAVIPVECALCHSTEGFKDYLGLDEEPEGIGVVDNPAPVGPGIGCKACHNKMARQVTSVTFPSGVTIEGLGHEAICMHCHQGRAFSGTVDQAITNAAAASDDTVSAGLAFINIHYYASGATLYGSEVSGGYQYAGKLYDGRFRHVEGARKCNACHDGHSLSSKGDSCVKCHTSATPLTLISIRMSTSSADYDGDGDTSEGIAAEIETLEEKLLAAIIAYAGEQSAMANICYDVTAYPYFFIDTNGDGECQDDEAVYDNKYASWTPRLVRAAYNYQFSVKDSGGWAHNAKYIIALLYDSIEDLNGALTTKVDMSAMRRGDTGHFDGAGESARHWDDEEVVGDSCSKCHSGERGFRFYLEYGVSMRNVEQGSGLECATCHDTVGEDWTKLPAVASVTFAGGATIDTDFDTNADGVSNLCGTCHSGRESKLTVDAHIAAGGTLGFKNVHYAAAAGTRMGATAHVGYEWDGQSYASSWTHSNVASSSCTFCHDPTKGGHSFDVSQNLATCQGCHTGVTAVDEIMMRTAMDYDGNGTAESLAAELAGLAALLFDELVTEAGSNAICYDSHVYPYFFDTTNTDGSCAAGDATYANAYSHWTADLLRAAFNYQFWAKEPGAWAHNFDYMGQLLYDSIAALGGNVAGLVRP